MWSPVALFLVTIAVASLVPASEAQLGNATHTADDILDIYADSNARIVNGKLISIWLVPWQVAIYQNGNFVCGGSIVSSNWVLTAASCVVAGGSFTIRAGSSKYWEDGQVRSAALVAINSGFTTAAKDYDIALIKVNTPFVWTLAVKPVKLARSTRVLPKKYFISGWGTTSEGGSYSPFLKGTTVLPVARASCRSTYSALNVLITNRMICASALNRGFCQGDTGGALVLYGIQYGIASFANGCGRTGYPGVYANVRLEEPWIRNVITLRGGNLPTFV